MQPLGHRRRTSARPVPPVLRAIVLVTAIAVMPVSAGCSRPAADNLLFISFDTTRADRVSAYGYERPTTPNVDRLAAQGVLFERAFSHVPSTLPSHSTMFTGLLPPQHGVRCNGWYRLPSEHVTLAERLGAEGFATAAVIGAFPLDNRFGLDQGFQSYDARFSSSSPASDRSAGRMDRPGEWLSHDFMDFERSAAEVTDLALAWLSRSSVRDGERWFLFAHYFDPHWPYEPNADWSARFDDPYDAELAYADHHLGRLLDQVEALPGRTLVVFTADHGEGLGDHGELLHNRFLYNATLRVPLVVRLDGVTEPGHRVVDNVSHVDLMPTVLELLGVRGTQRLGPGVSLTGALKGGIVEQRPIYAETLVGKLEVARGTELRALIDGDFKLIRTDIDQGHAGAGSYRQLYDIARDVDELLDLLVGGSTVEHTTVEVEAARTRLEVALEEMRERLEREGTKPERMPIDDVTRAKLEALGYL